LLDGAPVTHPWLGVANALDISSSVARQMGVSGGAQVGKVWPGSPASRIGLDSSDIITSFDGQPVTSCGTLTQLLSSSLPGKRAMISYLHKGKPVEATLVVSDQSYAS
jgi:serine protease Do